ncbi:MAG TPA: hypothetical protein VNY05_44195 [Candidatus Acidoferrales bacterium]|nr:hypothetical protein [Candidatus Acidoferrales bacterium]
MSTYRAVVVFPSASSSSVPGLASLSPGLDSDIVIAEETMLKRICALMLCMSFAFAADVTGTWQLTVETTQGSGSPTVVFQQEGEQLTGTFKSQIFGEAKIAGSVKGNAIEFGFDGDVGGQKITVSYKGTIEGPTAMKGTAVYAGIDEKATWSATKK